MFLSKYLKLFKEPKLNPWLAEHGFYACSSKYAPHYYGQYPDLPYPLVDLLKQKSVVDKDIFVCEHGSTARWLFEGKNRVSIARPCRGNVESSRLCYLPNAQAYPKDTIDLLVLDSKPDSQTEAFLCERLSDDAVILIIYKGWPTETVCRPGTLRHRLTDDGWRRLVVIGPAPRCDVMTGEVWYRRDNFLNI